MKIKYVLNLLNYNFYLNRKKKSSYDYQADLNNLIQEYSNQGIDIETMKNNYVA